MQDSWWGTYESSRRAETSFLSIIGFLGPLKVSIDKDGLLTTNAFTNRGGAPRKFREIAPFVWRDVDSGWRLAAKVSNGKVQRLSIDEISPFTVYEPGPWWRNPSWLAPSVALAFSALLLTTILWPVAAIVRRKNNLKLDLVGREERGRLISRIATVAVTLVTLAWLVLFLTLLSRNSLLAGGLDPLLFVMHLISVVVYVGGRDRAAMGRLGCLEQYTPLDGQGLDHRARVVRGRHFVDGVGVSPDVVRFEVLSRHKPMVMTGRTKTARNIYASAVYPRLIKVTSPKRSARNIDPSNSAPVIHRRADFERSPPVRAA